MTTAAVHIQLASAAVDLLRADSDLVALLESEGQIRSTLDTSGSPAGISAVVVRARDLGGHQGLSSRVLVDVELTVTVRTHLDEDPDRTAHDAAVAAAQAALPSGWAPALTGWVVRHVRAWEVSDARVDESGVFRDTDLARTVLVQASSAPALGWQLDGGTFDTEFPDESVDGGEL